uniref:Ion transport domain-containing protein n=1 Tax=Timema poppense TaxID=170557 RepID=A0A7R9CL10_TIMPO|nr:unnamed protein product [Timema poppensis]
MNGAVEVWMYRINYQPISDSDVESQLGTERADKATVKPPNTLDLPLLRPSNDDTQLSTPYSDISSIITPSPTLADDYPRYNTYPLVDYHPESPRGSGDFLAPASPGDIHLTAPTEFPPKMRNGNRKKERWWQKVRVSGQDMAGMQRQRRTHRRQERLNTELLIGVQEGDYQEVLRSIQHGANPNATCVPTRTAATHVAALLGHCDILSLLLERGAEAQFRDLQGRSLLHFAVWGGDERTTNEVIRRCSELVNQPVSASSAGNQAPVPEEWKDSCHHTHNAIKKLLPTLEHGSTPLHVASQRSNLACTKSLLAAGGVVNTGDELGLTPLDVVGEKLLQDIHHEEGSLHKVIEVLLEAEAKTTVGESGVEQRHRTTPVHAAVAMKDLEAIKRLAEAEIPPAVFDLQGATPVHLAVSRQMEAPLKVLLQEYNTAEVSIVDLWDTHGQTPLHQAVMANWLEGVCVLLEAGADLSVRARDTGATPLHLAAESGSEDILEEFIGMPDINSTTVNLTDNNGATPLNLAIRTSSLKCVELLLMADADVSVILPDKSTVLHQAARRDSPVILEALLKVALRSHPELLDTKSAEYGETPLHVAARAGHFDCVKKLLDAGCDVTIHTDRLKESTAIHLAANAGYTAVVRVLLQHDPDSRDEEDAFNRTPLHVASKHGQRECARVLVDAGADLSAEIRTVDNQRKTAMDYIIHNIPQPISFLGDTFDSSIKMNDHPINDPECEITVNYDVLVPLNQRGGQMKVLCSLVDTGNQYKQYELLLHPLVQSFLYLKWRKLSFMFYVILVVFAVFVVALTVLCTALYCYPDKGESLPSWFSVAFLRAVVLIFLGLFFLQEFAHALQFPKYYLSEMESWLKWSCFVLSTTTALVDRGDAASDWRRDVAAAAVLIAWTEFMFLLSRQPYWGYYVLMFFKVATNVFKVFLTFTFLFIGFTMSFMIQFRGQAPFSTPWDSMMKLIVMMMNEFEYGDIFDSYPGPFQLASRLTFLLFLLLVSIVLMNLMVGMAVSDINVLESKGLIGRLRKQVDFLRMLEFLLYNDALLFYLPIRMSQWLRKLRSVKTIYKIYPGRTVKDLSKILKDDVSAAIISLAVENKKFDTEYTLQDVYQKLCEISDGKLTRMQNGAVESSKLIKAEKELQQEENNTLGLLMSIKNELVEIKQQINGETHTNFSQKPISKEMLNKFDILQKDIELMHGNLKKVLIHLLPQEHILNIPQI